MADGLWTNYNDGTWPSCCREPRFDMKEIAPLLEALQKYWPSLSCSGSSTCHGGKGPFWAHEVCHDDLKVIIHVLYLYNLPTEADRGFTICSNEAGFRNQMLDAIKGVSKSNKNVLFINSCFAHCQSESQDMWFADDSPMIEDKSVALSVGDWFFDRVGVSAIDCLYPCDIPAII
ncbi:hypothetical protein Syun_001417 [Stephania yunnanensis]|uniref:Pectin acetylesterase n=1 Tax=Stephania yunnanensis TaxID=152371 RepID=A0AAP0LFL4_9MAGN